MRYLVDTHILLWWTRSDKRLKTELIDVLKNPSNQIYASVVSGIEIAIKMKSGKIRLKSTLSEVFKKSGFRVLDVNLSHAQMLTKLPVLHKDPFDRILIAQARVEKLILITTDAKIKKYKVKTLD